MKKVNTVLLCKKTCAFKVIFDFNILKKFQMKIKTITCDELAVNLYSSVTHGNSTMCIDTRSILQYNDNHVTGAYNICCSKIIRRKLQYNRISIKDLISNNNEANQHENEALWNSLHHVVLYDEASWWDQGRKFNSNHVTYILVEKFWELVPSVLLLEGENLFIFRFFYFILNSHWSISKPFPFFITLICLKNSL